MVIQDIIEAIKSIKSISSVYEKAKAIEGPSLPAAKELSKHTAKGTTKDLKQHVKELEKNISFTEAILEPLIEPLQMVTEENVGLRIALEDIFNVLNKCVGFFQEYMTMSRKEGAIRQTSKANDQQCIVLIRELNEAISKLSTLSAIKLLIVKNENIINAQSIFINNPPISSADFDTPELGISNLEQSFNCEKVAEDMFRVIINYRTLGLTRQQRKNFQTFLKGGYGEEAYAYIQDSSVIEKKEGNVIQLAFDDKESADILIKELKNVVMKWRQQSTPNVPRKIIASSQDATEKEYPFISPSSSPKKDFRSLPTKGAILFFNEQLPDSSELLSANISLVRQCIDSNSELRDSLSYFLTLNKVILEQGFLESLIKNKDKSLSNLEKEIIEFFKLRDEMQQAESQESRLEI